VKDLSEISRVLVDKNLKSTANVLRNEIEDFFRFRLMRQHTGRPRENVATLWRETVAVFVHGDFLHDIKCLSPCRKKIYSKDDSWIIRRVFAILFSLKIFSLVFLFINNFQVVL